MKKYLKIAVSVVTVAALGYVTLNFLASKGIITTDAVPGARTIYNGEVQVKPVSLAEIEAKLKAQNKIYDVRPGYISICAGGLPVMGGCELGLTRDNILSAYADIPGAPNERKFKAEVRKKLKEIGDILSIEEDTWVITTTYPVSYVY